MSFAQVEGLLPLDSSAMLNPSPSRKMAARRGLVTLAVLASWIAGHADEVLGGGGVQEPVPGWTRCWPGGKCTMRCEWPLSKCEPRGPRSGPAARRVAVIISAWGRSGTTFLGQILQRNRDFLYLYEPLRAQFRAHFGPKLALYGEQNAALLGRLADCALTRRDRAFLYKEKVRAPRRRSARPPPRGPARSAAPFPCAAHTRLPATPRATIATLAARRRACCAAGCATCPRASSRACAAASTSRSSRSG